MDMKRKQVRIKRAVFGTIFVNARGNGYLKAKDGKKEIKIGEGRLNTALNGDTVEVISYKKGGDILGEVVKIISRAKVGFSGTLKKEGELSFLKPDDIKMYRDIAIPKDKLSGAKSGDKIYAEISSWKDKNKNPEGKVVKILGKAGENEAEMKAIAIEKGFDSEFSEKVKKEALEIREKGIKKKDYENRRDFRKILTFTIDPENAKDFDDAISFRILPPLLAKEMGLGGEVNNSELYEVGIHIADVTHYVKIGGEIDREARKRATSLYLVDRTIPMLPEELSDDLCSLLPGKDRLTTSAVFILDKNVKVLEEWFGKTVIHSEKRFIYEEADKNLKEKGSKFHRELSVLWGLSQKLNKKRFDNGSISLEQEEVKFVLDEKGKPLKIAKKERGDSSRMIEEFMLLANRKVAEAISKGAQKNKGVFVYRVHENPSKEKMADLAFFLKGLGYKIEMKNGIIPSNKINELLKSLSGKNEKDTVHRAVIRSMAKAIYSTKNIGHYGLAFEYYAHFTSPIRRYPDMTVHRLLDNFLKGREIKKENWQIYEEISRKSSEREKYASDAERASIKYKQVEYMASRLGQSFSGIISGVTEWGLYVEESETKCEGLVRLRDMTGDFYIFNEKKQELIGQKTKKVYRLGDPVQIKLKGADLERKTIDYVLL